MRTKQAANGQHHLLCTAALHVGMAGISGVLAWGRAATATLSAELRLRRPAAIADAEHSY